MIAPVDICHVSSQISMSSRPRLSGNRSSATFNTVKKLEAIIQTVQAPKVLIVDKFILLSGVLEEKGELVDGFDEAEVKIGRVDMDIEENVSIVSSQAVIDCEAEGGEGLEGTEFGSGCVIAENDKGLVLESEGSSKNVESSLIFVKDGEKDENLREWMKGEVVSAAGVKFTNNNESLGRQDFNFSSHFKTATRDGLENQALEVNVVEKSNGYELTPTRVSENTEIKSVLAYLKKPV